MGLFIKYGTHASAPIAEAVEFSLSSEQTLIATIGLYAVATVGLEDGKALVVYVNSSGAMKAFVATYTSTTVTIGSELTLYSGGIASSVDLRLASSSSTEAMLIFTFATSSTKIIKLTISGTTVSAEIASYTNSGGSDSCSVMYLDTDLWITLSEYSSSYLKAHDSSGTLTAKTGDIVLSTDERDLIHGYPGHSMAKLTSTDFLTCGGSADLDVFYCEYDSVTPTISWSLTVFDPNPITYRNSEIFTRGSGKGFAIQCDSNNNDFIVHSLTYNTTLKTVTEGTTYTLALPGTEAPRQWNVIKIDDDNYVIKFADDGDAWHGKLITLKFTGDVPSLGTATTDFQADDCTDACMTDPDGNERGLIAYWDYNDGGLKCKIYNGISAFE